MHGPCTVLVLAGVSSVVINVSRSSYNSASGIAKLVEFIPGEFKLSMKKINIESSVELYLLYNTHISVKKLSHFVAQMVEHGDPVSSTG